MPDVRCPECGEGEALRGTRVGEVIELTCERCGHAWTRDPRPRCPSCGSDDLSAVPKTAVVEKARGNQMSPVGTITVHLCPDCDRELLDWHQRTRAPLPPDGS